MNGFPDPLHCRHLMVGTAKPCVLVLSVLVSSVACSSPVTSPNSVVIEIPNQPVQQTRLLSTPRILTFCDSLTEGSNGETMFPPVDPATPGLPHSYPYKLQALLAQRYTSQTISVFNGGIGGKTAAESQPRLADLISQFKPDVMILLCGVNDLNNGDSVGTVIGAMDRLIDEAQSRGVYVVLSTLTRQREGGRRAFSPRQVEPYNVALRQLAATGSAIFADVYPLVTDALIASDGLHLTESGNAVLAAAYFEVLRSRFEYAQAPDRADY